MRTRFTLLSLAITAALVVAACGKKDEKSKDEPKKAKPAVKETKGDMKKADVKK